MIKTNRSLLVDIVIHTSEGHFVRERSKAVILQDFGFFSRIKIYLMKMSFDF